MSEDARRARRQLEGAVVALVAEFIGAVTGTRPPLERTMFPPAMEPALRCLCDGLIQAVRETKSYPRIGETDAR